MNRLGLRLLLTLLATAALALAGLGTPAATAASSAPAVSFLGAYAFHGVIGGQKVTGTIQINADGTVVNNLNKTAHWTSSGKTITIVYKAPGDLETYVGTHSKKGIGSKKHPGTVTIKGGPSGTWYAVKTG